MANIDHCCPKCKENGKALDVKMQKKIHDSLWPARVGTSSDPVKVSHFYVCPECGYMELYAEVTREKD